MGSKQSDKNSDFQEPNDENQELALLDTAVLPSIFKILEESSEEALSMDALFARVRNIASFRTVSPEELRRLMEQKLDLAISEGIVVMQNDQFRLVDNTSSAEEDNTNQAPSDAVEGGGYPMPASAGPRNRGSTNQKRRTRAASSSTKPQLSSVTGRTVQPESRTVSNSTERRQRAATTGRQNRSPSQPRRSTATRTSSSSVRTAPNNATVRQRITSVPGTMQAATRRRPRRSRIQRRSSRARSRSRSSQRRR